VTADDATPLDWLDIDRFVLDGVTYRTFGEPDGRLDAATIFRMSTLKSSSEEMVLAKTRRNIDRCLEIYGGLRPLNVLELGIYEGGSVAFLTGLCRPSRLVALDLEPEPRPALERLLAERGLSSTVTLRYGVDQADRERIPELVELEFDGPLDLVIDDASHLLAETRISFNMLFPRVRPGGWYVIEDWAWAHTTAPGFLPDQRPMSELVFELVVAAATADDVVAEVKVDRELTAVRRGTRPLDPATFEIGALIDDRGRSLLSPSYSTG
jgi:predicted O-methyltransferase YrrM